MDDILQKERWKYAIGAFSRVLMGFDILVISFIVVLAQEGFTGISAVLLFLLLASLIGILGYITKHSCICKIWQADKSIRLELYLEIAFAFSVGILLAGLQFIGWLSPEYRNFWVYVFMFVILVHSFIFGSRMNRRLSQFC